MFRRISVLSAGFIIFASVAGSVWAAKPDTTPPGSLALSVVPGIRGLSLSFVATGDDGTSGTATAYETRIAEIGSGGACSSAAWPPGWTTVPKTPLASGNLDSVYFSPLASGRNYCMQLRARDDAHLYSAPATILGSTLDANWTLSAVPGFFANAYIDTVVDTSNPSNETVMMAVLDKSAAGVTGVKVVRLAPATTASGSSFDYDVVLESPVETPAADDCLLTGADCVVQIPLTNALFAGKLDKIDAQDLSTSPAIALGSGVVGILVVGKLGSTSTAVLLERDSIGWHSEAVARPAETITSPSLGLTYVGGNPIYTWVRADSADVSTLVLAERTSSGWSNSDLFARHRASCTRKSCPPPPLFQRFVFRDDAGRLKIYVAPDASNGGVNGVYLVRTLGASDAEYGIAGCSSLWTYYFTPLLDAALGHNATLDQGGHLIAAAQPSGSSIRVELAREDVASEIGPQQCGTTLGNAGNVRDVSLQWTNVASDVPSSWTDGHPLDGPQGLSSSACGVEIGLNVPFGNGYPVETQVINYDATGAHTQRVDHVAGRGTRDALQIIPSTGERVLVYWNQDQQTSAKYFVFARGPAASCP